MSQQPAYVRRIGKPRTTRAVKVVAVAILQLPLVSQLPSAPAFAEGSNPSVPIYSPGPIDPGYTGLVSVVPAEPDIDGDLNAVEVPLQNASGEVVGTGLLEAGREYSVTSSPDADESQVAISWTDGLTAIAERRDLWSMPDFVGLKDLEVVIRGVTVPLGQSAVFYHRERANAFNDSATPAFDGVPPRTRQALRCEVDDWSIGQQTFTVDFIEAGVHRDDPAAIAQGIVGLRWGTSIGFNEEATHEMERECNGGEVLADHGETHHSTQWLESMSRAVYLLAASRYAGEYRQTIDETIDRIEVVAAGLTATENWNRWVRNVSDENGDDWTHRTYMMAAALGMASTLTDVESDAQRWRSMAESIARRGIANQWDVGEVGVNPERGGYDVQYHMYGVWLAELYLSTLDDESAVRPQLVAAISRAIDWERSRIDPATGKVDIRGSTRVCNETNWWTNESSARLDPAETIRALLLWGQTQSDPDLVALAVSVSDRHVAFGHPCPQLVGVGPAERTRPFEDPRQGLSAAELAAAAAVGVLAALILSRMRLARWRRPIRVAIRVGAALAMFATSLLVLAN